ncbi:TonB family protein [Sulfitobacter sp. F26204]|uniref:energy transducer TonB family protein n=1 Tax=Sulfitobacter sp. F26204 TaxID=2996014 RepID=UPI00225E629D|nr:TonB family protein [Sulfitobacter sp. F26204]MCX7559542.1 TonB family protein [Sulfitobacter sp. F26204]
MIVRSRLAFAIVLGVSSALHLGAMTLLWTAPSPEIEGGTLMAETSFGSSFSDLAEGVQQATETLKQVTPNTAPAITRAVQPEQLTARSVAVQATPAAAQASTPIRALKSSEHAKSQPVPGVVQQPAPVSAKKAQPVQPELTVSALPEPAATPVSVRSRMPAKRPEPSNVKPVRSRSKQKGNASRNAKAGQQTGHAAKPSQARQAGKAVTKKAQGGAAASNYPGLVMQRISRVPRPRTSARGVAVIRFSIAANGRLASASVAGSSGSGALDQAALAVVRKAQPFPPPPNGARRSYSIKIKGR